jgi:exodeoxyribonuclease V alpha subunit
MTTTFSTEASAVIPPAELAAYVAADVVSATDVAAVAMLVGIARRADAAVSPNLRAWIAMCLALRAPRGGNTCVPLDAIDACRGDFDAADAVGWTTNADDWAASLESAGPLVGSPGDRAPFIRAGNRLYLARSLHEECEIERLLKAAGDRLEILLGGPGTGKTTQVAVRLVDLLRDNPQKKIALAAPTGKAAARMAEALQQRLTDPKSPAEVRNAPQAVRDAITAAHPTTVHSLLHVVPEASPRYKFRAGNPLAYELVVIDEVSMMSSSLMYHLLAALGDDTQILLVGDPDQLASVDAGTVLGDMAEAARDAASPLSARTSTLKTRHRFGPRIGALADAILEGEGSLGQAFEILEGRWSYVPDATNEISDDPRSVRWVQPGSPEFKAEVAKVADHAARLRALAKDGAASEAVAELQKLQVLCAHRQGALGVAGWNALVQRRLGVVGGTQWYSGRPVLVTANNRALNLHNGDMGVIMPGLAGKRKDAVFPDGKTHRRIAVSRLETVDTVHALTIHKSQGSEYDDVIVVLPEKPSRIVTRELLYTGMTRAKKTVTVIGSREVIEHAIRTPIRRATGLAARLKGG